jgi:hypothetical protein
MLWTYSLIFCAVVGALIIWKMFQGEKRIELPRSTGTPRSNEAGSILSRNECPVCRQAGADFYYGPVNPEFRVLYCANPECRTTFKVENYGGGRVYADIDDDEAPAYLYGLTKRRS